MTVGEQAPKVYSIQRAESTSLAFALPLHIFVTVLKPMIWFINWISNLLIRLAGGKAGSEHGGAHDIAEVRAIIGAATEAGHLTPGQKVFSENILDLVRLEVRHVMVPRIDVAFLSTKKTRDENLAIIRETGHSRFPLADPDLDHVAGLIHSRALLGQMLDSETPNLLSLARKCPTVPDTQPLPRMIRMMQKERTHCANVVDEHGTSVGFAFLEDAIEEIVGPIYDEFDEEVARVERSACGAIELEGNLPLPEAENELGVDLEGEADTIGGLVVAVLGRIPRKGESVEIGSYRASVLAVAKNRVVRVRFEKPDPEDASPADADE
jgi:CBS domain containing-hemolysin-like protein